MESTVSPELYTDNLEIVPVHEPLLVEENHIEPHTTGAAHDNQHGSTEHGHEDADHGTEEHHGEEVHHEHTIFAEPLFHVGNFTITNSLFTGWIAVVVLLLIGLAIRLKLSKIPGRLQTTFEVVLDGALSLADQVTGDRKLSERILPIALIIFMFVLVNNWMGIIPGVGSIGQIAMHDGHAMFIPFLRGATADVNTTLALGVMAVVGANIFGMISIGIWKTFNKYVNLEILGSVFTKFKKDPTIIIVAPITFFVGIVEIIGEIAKVASLSFRLFGNVFAGEVLLAAMAALLAYAVPIPFIFLEVLVGFIQALIFAMLTLVYFTIASHDHSEEH